MLTASCKHFVSRPSSCCLPPPLAQPCNKPLGQWAQAPTATGPQPPTSFSATTGENIAWRTPMPETGQGGIAIANGRLFVATMAPWTGVGLSEADAKAINSRGVELTGDKRSQWDGWDWVFNGTATRVNDLLYSLWQAALATSSTPANRPWRLSGSTTWATPARPGAPTRSHIPPDASTTEPPPNSSASGHTRATNAEACPPRTKHLHEARGSLDKVAGHRTSMVTQPHSPPRQ